MSQGKGGRDVKLGEEIRKGGKEVGLRISGSSLRIKFSGQNESLRGSLTFREIRLNASY